MLFCKLRVVSILTISALATTLPFLLPCTPSVRTRSHGIDATPRPLPRVRRPLAVYVYGTTLIDGNGEEVGGVGWDGRGAYGATWSPDSNWLAFARCSEAPEKQGIFVSHPDDSGMTRLTNGKDSFPAWSPDGKRIAFERYIDANRSQLCLVEVATRKVTPLTDGKYADSGPSWSRDGNRIVYTTNSTGQRKLGILSLSEKKTWLIRNQPEGECFAPAWSPTGDTILFNRTSEQDSTTELHTISSYGSNHKQLPVSALDSGATWSQDGERIAFVRHIANSESGLLALYTATAQGTDQIRLYPRQGGSSRVAHPAW